jgi:ATP-binding cassette subfamily B protein
MIQKIRNIIWSEERHQSAKTRVLMAWRMARTSIGYTTALVSVVVFGSALPVMFTIASGVVVGSVPAAVGHGLHTGAAHRLFAALGVATAIYVVQQLIGQAQSTIAGAFGQRFDTVMQARLMEELTLPAGTAHLEDPVVQDKIAVVRGWTMGFPAGASIAAMATIASQFLQIFFATAILVRFNAPIAILIVAELAFVSRPLARKGIFTLVKVRIGQAHALRQADYYRDLILQPKAAKEVRVFGLPDWISGRFSSHWTSAMKDVWSERSLAIRRAAIGIVISWIPLAMMFVALGHAAASGRLTLTALSIYAMAVFNVYWSFLLGVPDLQVEYGQAAIPAERELDSLLALARLGGGSLDPAGRPRQAITFESVSFSYPNSARSVFDGLDLEIRAGESTAIVGANGAGKTTLIKLLCRFFDPDAGRITVDGTDLREFDARSWQRRVAAIFQDFAHYEFASARENIAFGALSLADRPDVIEDAAKRTGVEEIINDLPHGWDTRLSRRFDGGADLSGGQWQRIAIARAIVGASEKGILILDEPTANLDVHGEAEIYTRFLELTQGLTTVLISHRFSTVRRADRIVVLEEGRVIEDGTHDGLMAHGGRYAHMFGLQAARFQEAADA